MLRTDIPVSAASCSIVSWLARRRSPTPSLARSSSRLTDATGSDHTSHPSSRRSSLPDAVRGSSSANSTAFGTLKRARRSTAERAQLVGIGRWRRRGRRRPRRAPPPSRGRDGRTHPRRRPRGARAGPPRPRPGTTFSPPVMIVSALRPMICSASALVEAPEVAGVQPAVLGERAGGRRSARARAPRRPRRASAPPRAAAIPNVAICEHASVIP